METGDASNGRTWLRILRDGDGLVRPKLGAEVVVVRERGVPVARRYKQFLS